MAILATIIMFSLFIATGNTHEGRATATSLVPILSNIMMAEAVCLSSSTAAAARKTSATAPPPSATIATVCKPVVSLDLDRTAFNNFSDTMASSGVSMDLFDCLTNRLKHTGFALDVGGAKNWT